jgi:hypothetical protein
MPGIGRLARGVQEHSHPRAAVKVGPDRLGGTCAAS